MIGDIVGRERQDFNEADQKDLSTISSQTSEIDIARDSQRSDAPERVQEVNRLRM